MNNKLAIIDAWTNSNSMRMFKQDLYKAMKLHQSKSIRMKIKLNSKHLTWIINRYTIPVLTYRFGMLCWKKDKLNDPNGNICSSTTKYKMHHPKSTVERFYIRKNGNRESGFRPWYSCSIALLYITDNIVQNSDDENWTIFVLLDFSKHSIRYIPIYFSQFLWSGYSSIELFCFVTM